MPQPDSPNSKISLHADRLTREFLMELSSDEFQRPRLSLFLPTYRHHPENQQNAIHFHHLLEELEFLLLKNHPTAQISALLEPLEALERDAEFWKHPLHGLAVFATPGWLRAIRLPHTVPAIHPRGRQLSHQTVAAHPAIGGQRPPPKLEST